MGLNLRGFLERASTLRSHTTNLIPNAHLLLNARFALVSKKINLKDTKVVTLVDSSTFGIDWMSWNSAGERENWVDEGDECSAGQKVTELLAEQVSR